METDIWCSFFHLYRSENYLIHKVKTFFLPFFFMKYNVKVVLTVRKCGFFHIVFVVVSATAAAAAAAVVVVVYPCVPLGTLGICEVSPSDCIAGQPLNLIPCFATLFYILENFFLLLLQVCFSLPPHLAPCRFQSSSCCFSVDLSPFLRV